MAGLVGSHALARTAPVPTPGAAEGPFYPTPPMRMPDTDNDLVKIAGMIEEAGGEIITLRGTVTDRDGKPRRGYRIEIWQCDVNGRYLHPGDSRGTPYDQAFQGFGHDITDDAGGYVFRTIKPAIYPGRAPHIHVKVLAGGRELLTTQFYVKGDPGNARDGLFNRMSADQAEAVSMTFTGTDEGIEAVVDIVL